MNYLLALALMLGAAPAFQTDINAELEKAKALYFDGRHQEAVDALDALVPGLRNPFFLADGSFYHGLSLEAVGQEERARQAFETAVRNNPDLVPQEDLFSEGALETFFRVRAALVGRLEIRTNPPGASTTIGGQEVGTTPYAGNAIAGEHRIRVELEDYHSYESLIAVEAGEVALVEATMRMTPEAIRRAQNQDRRNRSGSKKLAYALIGGGAAGGAIVGLSATGSSREAGVPVTRTFQNTVPPFNPGGPFIADVGTTGTLQVDLTWDNPDAALFVSVRLVTAVFETIFESSPTDETSTRFSVPVEAGKIYHVVFQNRTPHSTIFTMVITFPG